MNPRTLSVPVHSIVVGAVVAGLALAGCTSAPVFHYPQAACAQYVHAKPAFSADVRWCAHHIEMRGDSMEIRVSWELVRLRGDIDAIYQITDEHNSRMYLTDQLGRRYDHTRVSGAALGSRYRIGSLEHGSFIFPLPRAGATTFQFHDDENGVQLPLRL